jgi:hypothetical protein
LPLGKFLGAVSTRQRAAERLEPVDKEHGFQQRDEVTDEPVIELYSAGDIADVEQPGGLSGQVTHEERPYPALAVLRISSTSRSTTMLTKSLNH